ncbi:MAG: 2OG-Fe(II) oxygenase, partial [Bacteroidota bacterium]
MSEVKISRQILDVKRWSEQFEAHAEQYAGARPYPHIQFDQFLENWAAKKAKDSFPAVGEEGWTHYIHVNEKKHGLNKIDRIPSFLQKVIHQLNHPDFVAQISKLTGIPDLLPDPSLEGGGLHQTQRDGFLNIHADFTVHPHKRNWRRRVNLLIYLNEDWQPEYKGDLELWSRDMKACEQKIAPLFNRVVLFNTDQDSYHGLPEPIQCPEDR